jgi:3-dehydroquinate dehydratase II
LRIIVLQGPNLNRLGLRKPEVYGTRTLAEIQGEMDEKADELGCTLVHFQSNSEGVLIDWLQERQDEVDAIICNPAGLTNYGLSLRDALAEAERDLAITHLSNIHRREEWRRHDVFAEVADVYLAGLGWRVYLFAIDALHQRHAEKSAATENTAVTTDKEVGSSEVCR